MKVVTLDEELFAEECRKLWRCVVEDMGVPDYVISIAQGGVHVANAMEIKDASVIAIDLKRKSTEKKNASIFSRYLKRLPYFLTNVLRNVEAISLKSQLEIKSKRLLSKEALSTLAEIPDAASVLIVDDAIDTGGTVEAVLEGLKDLEKTEGRVEVAVLVTTMDVSRVQARYCLYRNVMCRFPWSLDFRG